MKPWKRMRIHHKLGLSIFAFIMILVFVLEIIVYNVFTRFYVQQLADDMIHRGHSHATALQEHWSEETLRHVAEMESYSRYVVAVIDSRGEILISSQPLQPTQMEYVKNFDTVSEYEWVVRDWRRQPYLISQSSVLDGNGKLIGYVVMYASTTPIREAIYSLRTLMFLFSVVSLITIFVLVFLFSNWISKPLVAMRNAVRKLTRNDYNFSLPISARDEIGELNQSIMELSGELKHYRTEREEFLAEISHELRTPITYIRGYADVLQQTSVKDEDRRKYLRFIREAADRLHRLIGDLYDMSKLDQVKVQIDKQEMDLVPFIRQMREEQMERFMEKGIDLQDDLPSTPVRVQADRNRLAQVIMNLLENARKYTPEGGSVRIRLSKEQREALIQIQDTGIGIPDSELPHIWRRFYRVEKSRSRDYGGAGLGLSIAKRIIELHDGTITVNSKEGIGTTFLIRLPLE
jgi:signal transduction histidine kinase